MELPWLHPRSAITRIGGTLETLLWRAAALFLLVGIIDNLAAAYARLGNKEKALAALGVAAILVVRHEISGGAMIAATLLLARAVAPIEQIVAVLDDAQVRSVLAGEAGALGSMAPGSAVIVVATITPATFLTFSGGNWPMPSRSRASTLRHALTPEPQ